MSTRRDFGAVDVARENNGAFLAVLARLVYGFAVIAPIYFGVILAATEHRDPALTPLHVLAVASSLYLTGFVAHMLVGLLAVMAVAAMVSLLRWRRVFAVGGPGAMVALLLSATRRFVVPVACPTGNGVSEPVLRRERTELATHFHELIDQLRAALLIAPDAPPYQLALSVDRSVRTAQLISRRAA